MARAPCTTSPVTVAQCQEKAKPYDKRAENSVDKEGEKVSVTMALYVKTSSCSFLVPASPDVLCH